MKCLRCNGSGSERKRPNLPRQRCYWCEGTGIEPEEVRDGRDQVPPAGEAAAAEAEIAAEAALSPSPDGAVAAAGTATGQEAEGDE